MYQKLFKRICFAMMILGVLSMPVGNMGFQSTAHALEDVQFDMADVSISADSGASKITPDEAFCSSSGDTTCTPFLKDGSPNCYLTQSGAADAGVATPTGIPDNYIFPGSTDHPELDISEGIILSFPLPLSAPPKLSLDNSASGLPGLYTELHVVLGGGGVALDDLEVTLTFDDNSTQKINKTVGNFFRSLAMPCGLGFGPLQYCVGGDLDLIQKDAPNTPLDNRGSIYGYKIDLDTAKGAIKKIEFQAPQLLAYFAIWGKRVEAPEVDSISPTLGKTGDTVTINGSYFKNASYFDDADVTVKIGSMLLEDVSVVSSSKITGKIKSGSTSGKITVTTPAGSDTSSSTFTVDDVPPNAPSVSGTTPTNDTTPTWTWTGDSGDGSGDFRYNLDSNDFDTATDTTALAYTPPSALGEGPFTLYVWESDDVGNWSDPGSKTLEIDTTPPATPMVGGTTPTTDTTPTWTWASGGGGNGNYEYQLDGGSWQSITGTSYTPSALSDGSHTLGVREQDSGGNLSAADSWAIVIDATPPNAPSVSGPSLTANNRPVWNWTPGGGDGSGNYRYKVDSGSYTNTTSTTFQPASGLSDGDRTLYVEERDAVNVGESLWNWSSSGSYTVTVDTTPPGPPSVTGTSSPTNDQTPTWNWSSSGGGNGKFRYRLDNSDLASQPETSETTFTPGSDLSEGNHTLYVQERDVAGNWSNSGSRLIEVDITPPNPPNVTATDPTNDQTPTWSWTSGGNGGYGRYRHRMDNNDLTGETETTATSFTSTNLAEGTYTLYVQERDQAGNWSDSSSQDITVDITPPEVQNVTSANAANSYYKAGETIVITVEFDEVMVVTGTPRIDLHNGGMANYDSGAGTKILTFNYVINSGDMNVSQLQYTATDALKTNGGSIRDEATNDGDLTLSFPSMFGSMSYNKENIAIDTVPPYIKMAETTLAPNNSYVDIVFSEGVFNSSGGALSKSDLSLSFEQNGGPTTSVTIDRLTKTDETALTGDDSVIRVHLDTDQTPNGVETVEINPAANSVYDKARYEVPDTETTGVLTLYDNLRPYVTDVTSGKADGHYLAGENFEIIVTFNETVAVNGTPRIRLETGATDRYAVYDSGDGTDILTFTYTVQAGDNSEDLAYTSANALELNGGLIHDGVNNAVITVLPTPGALHSLSRNKNIVIDTTAPSIADGVLDTSNAFMDVIFSEPVYNSVGGTLSGADFILSYSSRGGNASTANITSVKKLNSTTFRVYVSLSDLPSGSESVAVKPAGAGSIFDFTGNAMSASQSTRVRSLNDKFPPVATISGVPEGISDKSQVQMSVGGSTVVAYKYRVDGGSYSNEYSVLTPLAPEVGDGEHTVEVIGRDAALNWQTTTTSATWQVDTTKAPTVITQEVTDISGTTGFFSAEIPWDGNLAILEKGFCWSTSSPPTIDDESRAFGSGTASFSDTIMGLSQNTRYYVMAYAVNEKGISYGNQVVFTTVTFSTTATGATEITPTSFKANWNALMDANGYEVDVSTDAGFATYVSGYAGAKASGNQLAITGLTGNTTYHYRVRVSNSGGSSEDSNTTTVTTANTPPSDLRISGTTVSESAFPGTKIGTLEATDPDPNETFSFSLVDGEGSEGNAYFYMAGSSLMLAANLDYEIQRTYTIRVQVKDSAGDTYAESFTVTVVDANDPPVADAGLYQMVAAGDRVTLDASGSSDSDGRISSYSWIQSDGPVSVRLSSPSGKSPTFTAPDTEEKIRLKFTLTVTDDEGLKDTDTVTVVVTDALPGGLMWKFKAGDWIASSPSIGSDGTIYVGCDDGYLYAITPEGDLKWKFETGGEIMSSPAIGDDGTIYVGSWDNWIYAIKSNGDLRWKYETGGEILSSPVVGDDGTIYVGSNDDYLYAFEPDGDVDWKHETDGNITASPVIAHDGTIYVGSWDQNLYAFNPSGRLLWSMRTGGTIESSPAIGPDGTIYVGSGDEHIYAVNPDGKRKWRYKTLGVIFSSPAVGPDGTIYVGGNKDYLYALNPEPVSSLDPNNVFKWAFKTQGDISSSPVVGPDGAIYVGSDDYHLYAINAGGSLKWKYKTGGPVYSSPAIGNNGVLYVGSDDGYLYAFNWGDPPDEKDSDMYVEVGWKYEAGDTLFSSPAIAEDGTIFVGCFDGHLYALRPDGTLKWKTQVSDSPILASPAVGGSRYIYIGSYDKHLYAIDPDGSIRWKFKTTAPIYASPAIGGPADSIIYIGSGDGIVGYFYAIDIFGESKGKCELGGYVDSSPAIGADGTLYVGSGYYANAEDISATVYANHDTDYSGDKPESSTSGSVEDGSYADVKDFYYEGSSTALYAIDHVKNSELKVKWKFETEGNVSSSPAVAADGTIYVGSDGGYLYAIQTVSETGDFYGRPVKKSSGALKWLLKTGDAVFSSPAIGADGTIYVGSNDGYFYAVSADGEQQWQYEILASISSSPAIGADGTLYVGSDDGYFYAINPDGTLKWHYKTNWAGENPVFASPAISADGTIYIAADDKHLYAIKGGKPWTDEDYDAAMSVYADSSWPKFGQNNFNLHRKSY